MIASIFTGNFSFDMLNGPVGIYHSVDSVVKTGIINLISWTALLSVNLGLMNLLPVPALDGGRILFVIYEAIFRKPVNKSRNNYYCNRCSICINRYGLSDLERYPTLFL